MVLTTTNSIEGFRILEYKGIVTGISYGSSFNHNGKKISFKDMFSMKKYYEAYSLGLASLKEEAFQRLKDNAKALNANAIVGIKIDIETVSSSTVLVVSVTGTAVYVATEK